MRTIKTFLLTGFLLASTLIFPSNASACGFFGFGCKSDNKTVTVVRPGPVFIPEFEQVSVVTLTGDGPLVQLVNDAYFATVGSATAIAIKFGAVRVEARPTIQDSYNSYVYSAGPDKGKPAFYRVVVFPAGAILKDRYGNMVAIVQQEFEVNAGILADYYRRIPEKDFPAADITEGYPPVTRHSCSLAELYVWNLLVQINNENNARNGLSVNLPSRFFQH